MATKDQLPPGISAESIKGRLSFVRLERKGFRPVELYLFTPLLDAERYTMKELVELSGHRGHVEWDLRYVKETLEMLTGKSVDIPKLHRAKS